MTIRNLNSENYLILYGNDHFVLSNARLYIYFLLQAKLEDEVLPYMFFSGQ